jgi:hypothetical protein
LSTTDASDTTTRARPGGLCSVDEPTTARPSGETLASTGDLTALPAAFVLLDELPSGASPLVP